MKILRPLLMLLALSLGGGAAAVEAPLLPFEAGAPAATPPALYSFADVYRLSLAGGPFGGFRAAAAGLDAAVARRLDAGVEVRAVSAAPAPEFSFAVSQRRDGSRWALALAGLFACAWVAHRRLASPY
ncbi:MAG TPA: hypothetical protein VE935_01735 [Burkholderiales bacterium]|nr:hypothetical protein [Burkholderiales bacterium]